MNFRDFPDTKTRREALEKELGTPLPHIASSTPDLEIANIKNCENMIGAAQVPMGIAGPLTLQGTKRSVPSEYYLPLATTEGALVASISRGCKAITAAGGAIASSYKAGMT